MSESIIDNFKADALQSFRNYKKLAERALEQVSDEEFFQQIDPESNSIAIIVKHIAGNLHSRWTDFLTTDGEKPDRFRDGEFITFDKDSRESLMQLWETGWQTLFDAIEPIEPEDFDKTVTIRGESHTIVEAINRQLTHYPMHIGQIIMLAKHFRSAEWKTLSVPRNRSAEFNKFLADKQAAGEATTNRLEAPLEFAVSEADTDSTR
jgi:hypothetical protein